MINVRMVELLRSSARGEPDLEVTFLVQAESRGELGLVNSFIMKFEKSKDVEAHDLVALEMLLSIPFYMRGKAFEMFWAFYRLSSAEQDVVKDFMLDMKSGRKSG